MDSTTVELNVLEVSKVCYTHVILYPKLNNSRGAPPQGFARPAGLLVLIIWNWTTRRWCKLQWRDISYFVKISKSVHIGTHTDRHDGLNDRQSGVPSRKEGNKRKQILDGTANSCVGLGIAVRVQYIPPGLAFSSSTICPHSVLMCFVWIWEQRAIISLYSINWLFYKRDLTI
jgi:hypothetical protein